MKKIKPGYLRAGLLLAVISSSLAPLSAAQQKGLRLFDGKTFNGWEGNQSVFRIQDGAVVAGSLKEPMPRNEFLCTTKEYGDFILRLQFKLLGDPARANAGVQFRSRRIPNHHEVIGYQADMGQDYWGALYDESRRKTVLARPKMEELNKVLRRNDWNEYEIHAEGRRIRLAINGQPTVDYTEVDEQIEQRGCICLQVHAGPPTEVRYKEITITPLTQK